jgi:hypothetical protein
LARDLRQELATLASKDYTNHSLLQLKKQGLIIDLMHACNVVEGLLAGGDLAGNSSAMAAGKAAPAMPTSPEDWAWARQLRYYVDQASPSAVPASRQSMQATAGTPLT